MPYVPKTECEKATAYLHPANVYGPGHAHNGNPEKEPLDQLGHGGNWKTMHTSEPKLYKGMPLTALPNEVLLKIFNNFYAPDMFDIANDEYAALSCFCGDLEMLRCSLACRKLYEITEDFLMAHKRAATRRKKVYALNTWKDVTDMHIAEASNLSMSGLRYGLQPRCEPCFAVAHFVGYPNRPRNPITLNQQW